MAIESEDQALAPPPRSSASHMQFKHPQYEVTPGLTSGARRVALSCSKEHEAALQPLLRHPPPAAVDAACMRALAAAAAGNDGGALLQEALRGAQPPGRPQPRQPLPTAAETAQLERARARYDAQQYDRLVENLTVTERENANRASLSTFRQQATMGVNIIFATITGFLVGYYASNFYTEEMKYRMIAGLVTMVGTIFLEVGLLIITFDRVNEKDARKAQEKQDYRDSLRTSQKIEAALAPKKPKSKRDKKRD